LDSPLGYDVIYKETFEYIDEPVDEDSRQRIMSDNWGSPHSKIIKKILEENHKDGLADTKKLSAAVKYFKEAYSTDFFEIVRKVPGIEKCLGRLAANYTLGLNTAADRDILINTAMPALGIDKQLFPDEMIITAEDLPEGRYKPDPQGLLTLMERAGATACSTIFVGDDATDILCARGAGVEPVVTFTGNITQYDADQWVRDQFEVKYFISDITELEELAPQIFAQKCLGKTCLSGSAN
jgi:phosphoglycolate phosphatase-like HAD superfamily hydrolase